MHIVLLGVNHRHAPIELRERLAFRPEHLPDVFARLRRDVGLQEALVLSTCNRVEIYAQVPELSDSVDRLRQFLSEHGGIRMDEIVQRTYCYSEPQSVRHLFAVTSGLDSMVLGEAEIVQQVKRAYEFARQQGATGKVFNVLFQRALNAAKAVRTQTGIGRGGTSIGGVAVELAEKIFGRLDRAVVVLIGAGKIGELTLKRLSDRGVSDLRIMNRSLDRAAELGVTYGAGAIPMSQLDVQLEQADILITSTSAPGYLLGRAAIEAAMKRRHRRPLCIVDLGVPRNVEPDTGRLDGVYQFDVDDLEGLVAHAHTERQHAVTASTAILDEKVDRFLAWWREDAKACAPLSSEAAAAR
jgi:glutamyl-tRNA reductase